MSNPPIPISTTQAQTTLSPDLRNNIYSALLSSSGIRAIESTLDETLRTTGFRDALKTYITQLFRSGQATTAEEAYRLAMGRIKMQAEAKGEVEVNGNGDAEEEVDLRIPKEVVDKGTKVVLRELEKVCEITYEDDK